MPMSRQVSLNKREDVGLLGAFAGRIEDDFRTTAIGQKADAIVVALIEAKFVEQLVGRFEVELSPAGCEVLSKKRASWQDGVGALAREAEEDRFIDLLAIDGERKGAAHAHVTQQLAPGCVIGRQVGDDCDM